MVTAGELAGEFQQVAASHLPQVWLEFKLHQRATSRSGLCAKQCQTLLVCLVVRAKMC